MSDFSVGLAALVIAAAHSAIFAVSWVWAARSRHVVWLLILAPTAVAWSLAGYPLIRVLTYGTRSFQAPVGNLQTAGFAAVLLGFGGFFVCALGALTTIVVRASARR